MPEEERDKAMQDLTARQIECIRLLLEEQQYFPAGYYSRKLCVSDKTLLKDLKEIQGYLKAFGLVLERKTGCGVYLEQKARHCRELLNDLERQSAGRQVSITSRRREIMRRLLLYPATGISIRKLSEEFYVNRSSIVNDFKYIEDWLGAFGLKLRKDSEGRHIAGQEGDIRRAIAALMAEYRRPEEEGTAKGSQSRLNETTRGGLIRFFPAEEVDFIEAMLGHLETLCGHTIGEPYYINLLTHILICLARTRKGKQIEQVDGAIDVSTYKSFGYAKSLAAIIRAEFDLEIGEAETYYIYKYLISSGIGTEMADAKKPRTSGEESISRGIAADMNGCIAKALRIDVGKNRQLAEGLLLHIRPMLNRLKYNIGIKSEILSDVQANYGELLGLCQAAMWCMSQKYSLKEAGLDEISYIATYYQAMVEAGRMEQRVLVVCHSGFGTSQLLTTKLRQNFPDWNIVDVLSVRQLEKRTSLEEIDFIVSTVPLEASRIPYIMVSVVLSEKDIRNIRNTLCRMQSGPVFSLPVMEEQFYKKQLRLHKAACADRDNGSIRSAHIKGRMRWGDHIEVVLGLGPENRTQIVRGAGTPSWSLFTYAPSYDILLNQLAELYQMLCSPKGRERMETCQSTEDLRQMFDSFAGHETELIPDEQICVDVEAPDKETAIRRLIPLLAGAGLICDEEQFLKDVLEREAMAVTSAGSYIAIPHGKSESVLRPGIAVGKLREKILWTEDDTLEEDERYVQVVILFAVHPEDEERDDSVYIRMLKHVFGRLGEKETARRLILAKDSETIRQLLR